MIQESDKISLSLADARSFQLVPIPRHTFPRDVFLLGPVGVQAR